MADKATAEAPTAHEIVVATAVIQNQRSPLLLLPIPTKQRGHVNHSSSAGIYI
jgi:hypothetical protein